MSTKEYIAKLEAELKQLNQENERLKERLDLSGITTTVFVPEHFQEIFANAEKNVRDYFKETIKSAENGEILINGERYLLIRSAALSYEFMDVFREFYSNRPEDEAIQIGNNFLFDIAHVLGKEDAKAFHKKMNLKDPVEKLSAGPVHFAFTGWANVEILPESNPAPDDTFFLKYVHHNSFEAQSWISAGRKSDIPVCTMNSGYSSGWCEESFGIPLTAVELECEAHGAENCTFIMAPPHKIKEYLEKEKTFRKTEEYDVPVFFERKYSEDKLKDSLRQKETLLQEVHHRVKNNLQVISSLLNLQKANISDPKLRAEFDTSISRVNTMARVQEMIYGNKNVSSINIEKYFSKLIHSLYQMYARPNADLKFEVNIDVEEVIFDPDFAIPLGLIINEIACNSMKHAFEEDGLFYLNLTQDQKGKYTMIAGDNGKGIEQATAEETLGMSLIEILCDQIEADLELNNSSEGLEYVIRF
ncbi:MAG: XylR N-terminal domain-containing protein [Crocinitomicaceae bacterium]|nr:XylR N-terminal domain-containing protein [Crocinitomicaceae bacterium]